MRSTRLLASVAAAALIVGCAGSHGSSVTPSLPAPSNGSSGTASQGFAYDASAVAHATLVGPASFGRLSVTAVLPMRDAEGLRRYAAAVNDPTSASYRHFLQPNDLADRFAISAADQTRAIAYFHASGLAVTSWKQRLELAVSGTQEQLERAFRTRFGTYRDALGRTFVAPMTPPSVAAGVPVLGSTNIVRRAPDFAPQLIAATGSSGTTPQQTASVFDYVGAYAAGFTGAGVTVGIIGTGPIQTSSGGRVGDLEAYKTTFHIGGSGTLAVMSPDSRDPVVNAQGTFSSPPPVTAPCNASSNPNFPPSESPTATCNPEDFETQIDTEQAGALAPDASLEYYLAYNANDGCPGVGIASPCPAGKGFAFQGLAEADEEVQTAIDRNSSDVLSLSYGGAEAGTVAPSGMSSPPYEFKADGTGLGPSQFAMLAAEGIAVFVSSADTGANECNNTYPTPATIDRLCVSYPASDPSVVAVGGVTTPVNGAGQLVGPISAWGLQTNATAGSGGGVSAYFAQPAFQKGPGIVGTTRNLPDLSLEAAPSTGVATLVNADAALGGSSLLKFGGTSVAAPQMAAMWALVLQACKVTPACVAKGSSTRPYRLGNPNPLFYGIYGNASTYASTFLPVTYGSNATGAYCYYHPSDTSNCPTPAPGSTATPKPVPIPIASGYNVNPNGGYNNVTGIGVPFARSLVRAVVGV